MIKELNHLINKWLTNQIIKGWNDEMIKWSNN